MRNKQNFISADFRFAKSSYDEYFAVGDAVHHEGAEENDIAIIHGFSIDIESNEIIAFTSKGSAHIDFLYRHD